MPLFRMWRNTKIASYEVVTITEGTKTKANAVLTGCTTEHTVCAANRAKCCSHILNVVDSWAETIFNTDSCMLVPSACRFNFEKKNLVSSDL